MTKFNYTLYKAISRLEQENLNDSLKTFLEKRYGQEMVVEDYGSYLFAAGNIPICLVAHLDTVHKTLPYEIYYDQEKQVIWSPQGIGADDRAGVYAIIELVKRGLRPYILFTWDEEVGAFGAEKAGKDLKDLGVIDFCIELDRRGKNDSVYYDCDNEDFEKYINSFGFETAIGSFSDISYICPDWGVAGVNLSIGYQNEHTTQEILNVDWMMDTIDKVQKICYNKEYDKDKFIYIESPLTNTFYGNSYSSWWGKESKFSFDNETKKACGYTYSKQTYKYEEDMCWECGGIFPTHKVIPIGGETYCDTCYDKLYNYCNKCHSIYKEKEECLCGDEN